MIETTEEAILLEHVIKTYPGSEQSLRGTKLEWKGPALWLRNLAKAARLTSNTVPPVQALRDLTLRIHAGEVFGLVGPNGSGKTTLIKIIAGLIQPTQGTGIVAGTRLANTREIRRNVSYVSTTGWMGLEWPLTAEENIRFFATLCGMSTPLARACRGGPARSRSVGRSAQIPLTALERDASARHPGPRTTLSHPLDLAG